MATTYYVDFLGGDNGNTGLNSGQCFKDYTAFDSITWTDGDEIRVKKIAAVSISENLAWTDDTKNITTVSDLTSELSAGDFICKDDDVIRMMKINTINATTISNTYNWRYGTETVASSKLVTYSSDTASEYSMNKNGYSSGSYTLITGGWNEDFTAQDGYTVIDMTIGTMRPPTQLYYETHKFIYLNGDGVGGSYCDWYDCSFSYKSTSQHGVEGSYHNFYDCAILNPTGYFFYNANYDNFSGCTLAYCSGGLSNSNMDSFSGCTINDLSNYNADSSTNHFHYNTTFISVGQIGWKSYNLYFYDCIGLPSKFQKCHNVEIYNADTNISFEDTYNTYVENSQQNITIVNQIYYIAEGRLDMCFNHNLNNITGTTTITRGSDYFITNPYGNVSINGAKGVKINNISSVLSLTSPGQTEVYGNFGTITGLDNLDNNRYVYFETNDPLSTARHYQAGGFKVKESNAYTGTSCLNIFGNAVNNGNTSVIEVITLPITEGSGNTISMYVDTDGLFTGTIKWRITVLGKDVTGWNTINPIPTTYTEYTDTISSTDAVSKDATIEFEVSPTVNSWNIYLDNFTVSI